MSISPKDIRPALCEGGLSIRLRQSMTVDESHPTFEVELVFMDEVISSDSVTLYPTHE